MGWLDRHKRHGVVPALIALALQIVLAFDHVHLHGVAQDLAHDLRATSGQSVALTQAKSRTPAPNPADDEGYCPICASIFLASSAFAPAPPPLPPPAKFQRVRHSFAAAAAARIEPLRLAFRSRAPPPV
jgi:hypothetical protein